MKAGRACCELSLSTRRFPFGTVRQPSKVSGLFTPRKQMEQEVAQTAQAQFQDNRVHHTEAVTGFIVYVSLFERMAAILADSGVTDALGQDTLISWSGPDRPTDNRAG